ncbi:MAG: VCBS repeat-containing protein, partial [Chitinophagaceae bacterium]
MRTLLTSFLLRSTYLISIIAFGSAFKHSSGHFAGNYSYYVSPAGDVNGDGYADILMSVFTSEFGVSKDGKVYLSYGTGSGVTQTPVWTGICTQDAANYGEAVANAGDVNADGFADIIIGASRFSNGEENEGAAFVYFGSPDGLKKESS